MAASGLRAGLLAEILTMAVDTLRTNKLRSFLTSLGGLIGIALGAGIGWTVHLVSGFPISLPWWSFAIGLGFSAAVGVFFGMYPAFKAARLDPIEALRYE